MVPSRYLGAKTQLVQRKARAFPQFCQVPTVVPTVACKGTLTLVPCRLPFLGEDIATPAGLRRRRPGPITEVLNYMLAKYGKRAAVT
jgi:hypothetical protein